MQRLPKTCSQNLRLIQFLKHFCVKLKFLEFIENRKNHEKVKFSVICKRANGTYTLKNAEMIL